MNQLRGGTLLIPSQIDLGFLPLEELTFKPRNANALLFVALSRFRVNQSHFAVGRITTLYIRSEAGENDK
jgi:hypothetical protein